jgi:hypothetical protein
MTLFDPPGSQLGGTVTCRTVKDDLHVFFADPCFQSGHRDVWINLNGLRKMTLAVFCRMPGIDQEGRVSVRISKPSLQCRR